MLSSEASCSECRLELIQKKWNKLLLKWINKCVHDRTRARETQLRAILLSDVMTKYRDDVCCTDIDRAITFTDDIEPFIKYKYPILRLRYLSEEEDLPKKLYIMTSMMLYHCCINSQAGAVHEDICRHFTKQEQELVLMFCEKLGDMETTINNVDFAIQEAFKSADKTRDAEWSSETSFETFKTRRSTDTEAMVSSVSTLKSSFATIPSDATLIEQNVVVVNSSKMPPAMFGSSATVVTDTSTYSDIVICSDEKEDQGVSADSGQFDSYSSQPKPKKEWKKSLTDSEESRDTHKDRKRDKDEQEKTEENQRESKERKEEIKESNMAVDSNCSCTKCGGPESGEPCNSGREGAGNHDKLARLRLNRKLTALVIALAMFISLVLGLSFVATYFKTEKKAPKLFVNVERYVDSGIERSRSQDGWKCTQNLCQKVYKPTNEIIYQSYSRCSLLCTGPQIWPQPIGHIQFTPKIIVLATSKLGYKLKTVPSERLERYLAEALKLFIGDLAKQEKAGIQFKKKTLDLDVKKINIQIDVESDSDPRMRINTEEAYSVKLETIGNQVVIKISSSSFCGLRHGLETLSQMILLDESTGYLITVSNADVTDAPSYKYRGLMIDTGRNYIPVQDLLRTIDGMAAMKLNTFHWRISDVTSFPLLLAKVPLLFEYGAYDRSLIYTKEDVTTIVKRAGVRGIRVLIEIAAPGPVGRAWSWSPNAACPSRNNDSCNNVLCTILDVQDSVKNILQDLYQEILEMTQVEDIFHLSNGLFSLANCYNLLSNRDGFLDKALDSLKHANKGFLPKLPIIWYTPHLSKPFEAKSWERFGVQLNEWKTNPSEQFLAKFRVIHSSKWELSCEMKKQRCKKYRNWQELYSWKSWRNLEAFTVEGGEATLWTDLVDSGNLDYHLWPRLAAVAERLWSDIIANTTPDTSVYMRLNAHRLRLLHVGVKVQPIWPAWCTANPGPCLDKIKLR